MRLSSLLVPVLTFSAAAGLSLVAASFAVTAVERNSEIALRQSLDVSGMHWAEVTADGLQVILQGTAPDEASRFSAISLAGGVVDAARVIDEMHVLPSEGLAPPRFSAEILRNSSGISIIGLVPAAYSRETLVQDLRRLNQAGPVSDLLESARYQPPTGWDAAMRFAVKALSDLPRAKISVDATSVGITTMAADDAERELLSARFNKMAPPGLRLVLDIKTARPVITPFTLRFLKSAEDASFDACSADSEESRDRILAAAHSAGLEGKASCTIGMGVPSPNWARAAELSIASLGTLGAGAVTIANADITLVAAEGTDPALFDKVVGELENTLPDVFALHAVLPIPAEEGAEAVPEFTATLSPEGQVQLRGRINDERARNATSSYAMARFGAEAVHTATRVVPELPADWPVRVLAGLEALSHLERGSVTILPDNLRLRGMSHSKETLAEVSGFLSARLGEAESYDLKITYEEPPAPKDQPMSLEVCAEKLTSLQDVTGKIHFEPGSATVAAGSSATLDKAAEVLELCGPIRLEIQGHTDSQGREGMNQSLSQARAQSILNELRARRIRTSTILAKGYGESTPIATNDSEEGREANRRIEFKVIFPEQPAETPTALEEAADADAAATTTAETAGEGEGTDEQETAGQ